MLDMLNEKFLRTKKQVTKIKLEIGELSCVDPMALEFAFKVLIEKSDFKQARLDIIPQAGVLRCSRCNKDYEIYHLSLVCPKCQQTACELTQGQEVQLHSVEVT